MDIKRKLQLGAAAVISNGLLALTYLTPDTAMANPCGPFVFCGICAPLSFCQTGVPAGCTATSRTCNVFIPQCPGDHDAMLCRYD